MLIEGMSFKDRIEFLEKIFEEQQIDEQELIKQEMEEVFPKDPLWLMYDS